MFSWAAFPFLRILPVFIVGILIARYLAVDFPLMTFFYLTSCFWLTLVLARLIFKKMAHAWWGHGLLALIFLSGIQFYNQSDDRRQVGQYQSTWPEIDQYIGVICSYPVGKEKYNRYELKVLADLHGDTVRQQPMKGLLYVKQTSPRDAALRYGDKIRVMGHPQSIPGPKNPHAFDYASYMAEQNVHFQHFTTDTEIQIIGRQMGNPLLHQVYALRRHFETTIQAHVRDADQQAIILALLLGLKDHLDADLKSAYAAAGAMHVLAVSGLHVSIIYFLLQWIVRVLPAGQTRRWLAPALSLVALWMYALVTGLSPSILRAVTMFTLIILAQQLQRKAQVFNSLAVAAFILLLIDPHFVFSVGYQLSFLAVAGILYLYPRLSGLWTIDHWLGQKIWQLTCVSLAAQIATFPLGLYYFHQFPTYFLLTNLVVIPAAFVIMVAGLALLLPGPWTPWIGQLLSALVTGLNKFVLWIEGMSGSVIDGIHFSLLQTWAMYLMIVFMLVWIRFKKKYVAAIVLALACVFSTDQILRLRAQSSVQQLVFYSIRGQHYMDHVQGHNVQLYSLYETPPLALPAPVAAHRIYQDLPLSNTHIQVPNRLNDFMSMIIFQSKKILYLTQPFDPALLEYPVETDLLVLSHQAATDLKSLAQWVKYDRLLLDNTNTRAYSRRIRREALAMGIDCTDLSEQALVIDLL